MDVLATVIKVVSEQLGKKPEEIKIENTIEDLGIDALDAVEIIMALEETLNITISDEEAEEIKTIDDLIKMVSSKLESGH